MSSTTHSDFNLDCQQAIHQLRSHWEFSNVAQFMHTFYNAFGLESFDTDELELSLATKESPQLTDLIVQMLRTLTSNKKIAFDNWERYLFQQYLIYEPEKKNPFGSEEDQKKFKDMSIKQKVLILHDLCHWQMRNPDKFRQQLDSQDDSQTWRVSPIGYDSKGNTYWLFDDNRLCKETPKGDAEKPKGRGKSARRNKSKKVTTTDQDESINWETVCVTAAEWEEFPSRFEKTRNSAEKAFFKLLTNDLLPRVLAVLKEKEKDRKKLDALANRKRSSRLLKKEIEKQEADRIAQMEKEKYEEERTKEKGKRAREDDEDVKLTSRESRAKEREIRLQMRKEKVEKDQQAKLEELRASRAKRENCKKIGVQFQPDSSNQTPLLQPQAHEQPNNDWYFECLCGVSGNNINDNSRMIACDRCSVWQHLDCISKVDSRFLVGQDIEKIDYVCKKCLRNTVSQPNMPVSSSHRKEGTVDVVSPDVGETKVVNVLTMDDTQDTQIVSKIEAQMDIDRISTKRPRTESDTEHLETNVALVKPRRSQTNATRKATKKDSTKKSKLTNDNIEREAKRIKNDILTNDSSLRVNSSLSSISSNTRSLPRLLPAPIPSSSMSMTSLDSYQQSTSFSSSSSSYFGSSMIPPRSSSYEPLCGTVPASSSNGLSNYTIPHATSRFDLPAISPSYGLSDNILRSTSYDVLPPIMSAFGPSVGVSAHRRSFEPFSGPIEPQYSGPHFSPYSRADGLNQTIPQPPSLLNLPSSAQYKNESNNEQTPKIMDIKSLVS